MISPASQCILLDILLLMKRVVNVSLSFSLSAHFLHSVITSHFVIFHTFCLLIHVSDNDNLTILRKVPSIRLASPKTSRSYTLFCIFRRTPKNYSFTFEFLFTRTVALPQVLLKLSANNLARTHTLTGRNAK